MIDHTIILDAIAAELDRWQRDGRCNASDSMVRLAEMLHNTGRLDGRLPHFYARRECRVLEEV
jgi:hypothetical protein